jgi:lipopolysaccharide export system permease protein|tara:strand:+ start:10709 stop:11779 length:1071 start_codon:yes stop_codon:yes gene_type:complete
MIKEFLLMLVGALVGFWAVFVIVDAVENLDRFIDAAVPINIIVSYYIYASPWFISIALPMAVLISTIFTVGLLSKRNELTAMKSAGVSLYRIVAPLIICSIIISILSFFFDDQVVTVGNQKRKVIEKEHVIKTRRKRYNTRKRNIFLQKSDQFHIAIDRYQPKLKKAMGVAMQFLEDGRLIQRIDANSMSWNEKEEGWHVKTYALRSFHPDGFESNVQLSRKDTLLTIDFTPEDLEREAISPEEKNYAQLKVFIEELVESGVDTTRWEVNLYGKVSFALTNLIVVLFAFPLVASKQNGGIAFGAGMSVFVIFGYYAFIRFGQTLGYKGILEPMLSAWIGNIVFLAGGILLIILSRK